MLNTFKFRAILLLNTFNFTEEPVPTTPRWRPQVLWVPMGLLLGGLSGATMGVVLLLGAVVVEPAVTGTGVTGGWGENVVLVLVGGTWYGGIAGLVVGLVVGVEMAFLVGAHLPRDVARRRAAVWGFVLPPVTMVGPVALVDGVSLSAPSGETMWWLVVLGGASLLGSRQARWLAGLEPPDAKVS
jgi:hypothetical protein